MAQPTVVNGKIFRVQKTITNTQFKALPTTPITMVVAPAATSWIQMVSGFFVMDALAGAYTNISDGGWISLTYEGSWTCASFVGDDASVAETALSGLTDLIGGATRRIATLQTYARSVVENEWGNVAHVNDLSGRLGKAVEITASNALGDFTGGNAANTLRVTFLYTVETL